MKLEFLTEDEFMNVDTFKNEIQEQWTDIYINPERISAWFLPTIMEYDFDTINLLIDGQFITVKQKRELLHWLDNNITRVKYEMK